MNGSWLTTKKRGRDDDLIEIHKREAEDERRRRKGLQAKQRGPKAGKKPKKNARAPTKSLLEGFVVDDNDDEVVWSEHSSSSEEETKAAKVTEMSSDSEVSSPDTFMGKHSQQRRTSKPSKGLMARSKNKYISRPNNKKKPAVVVDLMAVDSPSSEEELVISPPPAQNRKEPPASKANVKLELSSEEEDNTLLNFGRSKNCSKPKPSMLVDTPETTSKKTKQPKEAKRVTELFDSSDDDELLAKPRRLAKMKSKKKKQKRAIKMEDYCSDEDEAIAIAAAMEESRKMMKTEEEEVIDLQEDESSEGEGFVVDEQAKAATSVLETANKLSALILTTMAKWSNSAVEGMIVDGALSLGEAKGRDHTWISQETLKDIVPEDIKLADYQLIGINWMALLHGMKCEVEGNRTYANVNGILADEMGLGKTCQAITFLNWLKHNQKSGESTRPHLIVAPASVLSNWYNEFARFAPNLKVVKFHGSAAEREQRQDQIRDLMKSGKLDIILASLTCFQKEKSEDRSFLRKIDFDYLVVDEAHVLSNAKSLRYKSMDKFKTLHRLLLTGTPVQNSPKELMSLLCFLMPLFSLKGSKFDDDTSQDGGEGMLQHFVSMQKGDDDHAAYTKLKQLFSPFVLRRRKVDVLGQILPPKVRKVEFVPMSKTAKIAYDAVIAQHLERKQSGLRSNDHLFTQLRKAAHHPLLLRNRYTSAREKEHLAEHFYKFGAFHGDRLTKEKVHQELEKFNDFEIHVMALQLVEDKPFRREELGRYLLSEDDLFGAEKCSKLREMLPRLIAEGHRILLFSVWTMTLDILSCLMEHLDIEHRRMDGQSPVEERQNMIDEFNRDQSIKVFLLSTKACGLGINLTSADTCVVHDLDFNPFNDLQAEDRCHRIGQKKPVTVIKLVTSDSVDESIYNMQQRKAKMNAAIMGSEAEWKKAAEKEKKDVIEEAVQRYLKAPESPRRNANNEKYKDEAASDEESL